MSFEVEMDYRTSDGYSTSVAGQNIVTSLLPELTAPAIKNFSLWVENDAKVILNDDGRERTVTNRLGMNYSDSFMPIKSIKFVDGGVNYFIAYGV